MTALIFDLCRVKRAVDLAREFGSTESQRSIAARIVADIHSEANETWEERTERALRLIGARIVPAETQHPRCRCIIIPLNPELTPESDPCKST